METFKPISLLVHKGVNFTPAALMRRWALEHRHRCGNGNCFEQYIVIDGKTYVYDHYEICYYDRESDMVTLYLVKKD